jgi:hypothetical protein
MDPKEPLIADRLVDIERQVKELVQAINKAADSQKQQDSQPVAVNAVVRQPEAVERQNATNQQNAQRTQNVIAVGAWAAFAAALAYAVVAQLQLGQLSQQTAQVYHQSEVENADASYQAAKWFQELRIAQDQAKAARDQVSVVTREMQEDQRAWLTIKIGNINWQEGQPISVPVAINNIGKTAAKKYLLSVVIRTVDNTPDAGKSLAFKYEGVPHYADFAGYLLPSDPHTDIVTSQGFAADQKTLQEASVSHEEAQKLMGGQEFIIAYATVVYRDMFGRSDWTNTCVYTSPSGKPAYAAKCTLYNDVDSN